MPILHLALGHSSPLEAETGESRETPLKQSCAIKLFHHLPTTGVDKGRQGAKHSSSCGKQATHEHSARFLRQARRTS
jgi:hypothetical protein